MVSNRNLAGLTWPSTILQVVSSIHNLRNDKLLYNTGIFISDMKSVRIF